MQDALAARVGTSLFGVASGRGILSWLFKKRPAIVITPSTRGPIVPGVMLVLTVLALNIFGDGVRDAFDPRAKVRMEL